MVDPTRTVADPVTTYNKKSHTSITITIIASLSLVSMTTNLLPVLEVRSRKGRGIGPRRWRKRRLSVEVGVRPLGVALGARAPLTSAVQAVGQIGGYVAPRVGIAVGESALVRRLAAVVPFAAVVGIRLAEPVAQTSVGTAAGSWPAPVTAHRHIGDRVASVVIAYSDRSCSSQILVIVGIIRRWKRSLQVNCISLQVLYMSLMFPLNGHVNCHVARKCEIHHSLSLSLSFSLSLSLFPFHIPVPCFATASGSFTPLFLHPFPWKQ